MIRKILKAHRAIRNFILPKVKEESIKVKVVNTPTSDDEVIED